MKKRPLISVTVVSVARAILQAASVWLFASVGAHAQDNMTECANAHGGYHTPGYHRCMGDERVAHMIECANAHGGYTTPGYHRCMERPSICLGARDEIARIEERVHEQNRVLEEKRAELKLLNTENFGGDLGLESPEITGTRLAIIDRKIKLEKDIHNIEMSEGKLWDKRQKLLNNCF